MYYLIEREYVGPNKRDSRGNVIGDSRVMEIWNAPGVTNMSREVRIHGWLGTTADISSTACGEYETIEAARAEAKQRGFTYLMDDEEMIRKHVAASPDFYPEVIERWIPDDAALPQVDASDWFYAALGWRDIADEYGITADSTDDDLEAAAELAEKEARDDGFILHFAYKEFEKIREYLRDEREEQEDDE